MDTEASMFTASFSRVRFFKTQFSKTLGPLCLLFAGFAVGAVISAESAVAQVNPPTAPPIAPPIAPPSTVPTDPQTDTPSNSPTTAQLRSEPLSSANGKYTGSLQVLNCPEDEAVYGRYHDYGYWNGGSWCGEDGEAGYWVWSSPNWYVWEDLSIPPAASFEGKYYDLLQVVSCPGDRDTFGESSDYGYWDGGSWCGETGEAGYWTWVYPNWYVWENQRR